MNVLTAQRTYKTVANATKALETALALAGLKLDNVRYFVGVSATDNTRFVPTLLGIEYAAFAHRGIMVVN